MSTMTKEMFDFNVRILQYVAKEYFELENKHKTTLNAVDRTALKEVMVVANAKLQGIMKTTESATTGGMPALQKMVDEIKVSVDRESAKYAMILCDRCVGRGRLSQYNHVENGVCFKCHGEGKVLKK